MSCAYRSVPTQDQILVPETLLKKRKSQEKERAEKAEQRETKKKVRQLLPSIFAMMIFTQTTTSFGYGVFS